MIKAYSKEAREELNKLAIEKYNNQYPCDLYGRFPWDCERRSDEDYKKKTVNLSKNSLGIFTYEVLNRGGDIKNFFVMGTSVFPRVFLTIEGRDDMIEKTGYCLNSPPVAHLS